MFGQFELAALDLMLSSCTNHPTDLARASIVLRAARDEEEKRIIQQIILRKRAAWLAYLTRTQRHWQAHTRNPSKANHHDSIATREKYVRLSR